jgi:hypothetical protein
MAGPTLALFVFLTLVALFSAEPTPITMTVFPAEVEAGQAFYIEATFPLPQTRKCEATYSPTYRFYVGDARFVATSEPDLPMYRVCYQVGEGIVTPGFTPNLAQLALAVPGTMRNSFSTDWESNTDAYQVLNFCSIPLPAYTTVRCYSRVSSIIGDHLAHPLTISFRNRMTQVSPTSLEPLLPPSPPQS